MTSPSPRRPPDPHPDAAAALGPRADAAGPGAPRPGGTPPARPPAPGPYGPRPAGAPPGPPLSHPAALPPPSPPDSPGDAWDRADPYARALRSGAGPLFLRRGDGWLLPLDVERWCGVPDGGDVTVLRRCTGPVLDIGCGPGRLVAALAALGRPALGVDVSSAAVAHARSRGAAALRRSVFEPLPGEGRWGTALLVDGNVGIGGDPAALLARAAALLRPRGRLVVEAAADDDVDERVHVHVTDGTRGHPAGRRADRAHHGFPWARVGLPALLRYAAAGRWREEDRWTAGGRRFAALRAPERTPRTARR
ncbi:class I SAM-dependent methyltransferase [Streptomyces sp. B5E4]|uniref:class I SAM-dependent methyltransferase n=1 Tax=Streptomyces sp. B5E4 TaxID=3153568 RepID=UPI00325F3CFD